MDWFVFVILFVLLFALATTYIVWKHRKTIEKDPYPNFETGSTNGRKYDNNGSSFLNEETCETDVSLDQRYWNGSNCVCRTPYYGSECDKESFHSKYYVVGYLDDKKLLVPSDSRDVTVSNLSFDNDNSNMSCTDHCDDNTDCRGVLWPTQFSETRTCTLLIDDVVTRRNMAFSKSGNYELLMKKGLRPRFDDRVFLFANQIKPDSPVWFNDKTDQSLTVYNSSEKKITFVPRHIINDGKLIGIYSLRAFRDIDVPRILQSSPSTYYIHRPGTKLEVPFKAPMYVMYVSIDN